jgi:hypothetical protein
MSTTLRLHSREARRLLEQRRPGDRTQLGVSKGVSLAEANLSPNCASRLFYGSLMALGCLNPELAGASFSREWKEALSARFFAAAPQRQRRSAERYNIVKRAKDVGPAIRDQPEDFG